MNETSANGNPVFQFVKRTMDQALEQLALHEAEAEQFFLHGWGAPPPSPEQIRLARERIQYCPPPGLDLPSLASLVANGTLTPQQAAEIRAEADQLLGVS